MRWPLLLLVPALLLSPGCGRGGSGDGVKAGGPVVVQRPVEPVAPEPSPSVEEEEVQAVAEEEVAPAASPSPSPSPGGTGPLTPAAAGAEPVAFTEIDDPAIEVRREADRVVYSLFGDSLFEFDSDALRPAASGALQQVAASIARRYPKAKLRVEGHTDSVGRPRYNRLLSERRAEAVRRWFAQNEGIPVDRMTVKGFGETRPVAQNTWPDGSDDPIGRRRNRRVEISVATSKASPSPSP